LVLVGSCYYLFVKRNFDSQSKIISSKILLVSSAISFFAGILSSFFGIGGGIVFVPLMIIGLGIAVKNATATSQLVLLFSSASGMAVHALLGHANYEYAFLMSIGSIMGGLVGARLSVEIKETRLRLLIIIVILIAAIKLFLDAFGI
ncbi:MAG: sulfite exporter TauE/SafE family protein, partial [Candidatus Nitrosotenuis sp.]